MFGAGKRLHAPERRVITGGAPLTERTARNFERFSGSRVCPLYGTTETGAIAVARPDGPMAIGGYVGPAFDGVEIDIRPPEEPAELIAGHRLGTRALAFVDGRLSDRRAAGYFLHCRWLVQHGRLGTHRRRRFATIWTAGRGDQPVGHEGAATRSRGSDCHAQRHCRGESLSRQDELRHLAGAQRPWWPTKAWASSRSKRTAKANSCTTSGRQS